MLLNKLLPFKIISYILHLEHNYNNRDHNNKNINIFFNITTTTDLIRLLLPPCHVSNVLDSLHSPQQLRALKTKKGKKVNRQFPGKGVALYSHAVYFLGYFKVYFQYFFFKTNTFYLNKGPHGTGQWPIPQCLHIFPTPQRLQNMPFIAYVSARSSAGLGHFGSCLLI